MSEPNGHTVLGFVPKHAQSVNQSQQTSGWHYSNIKQYDAQKEENFKAILNAVLQEKRRTNTSESCLFLASLLVVRILQQQNFGLNVFLPFPSTKGNRWALIMLRYSKEEEKHMMASPIRSLPLCLPVSCAHIKRSWLCLAFPLEHMVIYCAVSSMYWHCFELHLNPHLLRTQT